MRKTHQSAGSHAERGNQGNSRSHAPRGNALLSSTLCVSLLLVQSLLVAAAFGDEPANAAKEPSKERPTREIYVPFSDLHVLLERQPKRVLLGRAEYDELVKRAKRTPETHAPRPAAIVAADSAVTVDQQTAQIRCLLTIDVLEAGLHALPLDLGGVGLETASLDGRSAALGRDDAGGLLLFVEGLGQHQLALEMVARLDTTAARQLLSFRLPRPAAAKLWLTVAGDVEIKAGADVISRAVDPAAKMTRFELLPRQGDMTLAMSLNSHFQRQQRAVMARSVLIDEVTTAYERLHATVSLEMFHRAVDQFRFVVPEGFEITEVTLPLLSRWDVRKEAGRKVLGVQLREPTTDAVTLRIAAIRRRPGWKVGRAAARTARRDRLRDGAGALARRSLEGRFVRRRGVDSDRHGGVRQDTARRGRRRFGRRANGRRVVRAADRLFADGPL